MRQADDAIAGRRATTFLRRLKEGDFCSSLAIKSVPKFKAALIPYQETKGRVIESGRRGRGKRERESGPASSFCLNAHGYRARDGGRGRACVPHNGRETRRRWHWQCLGTYRSALPEILVELCVKKPYSPSPMRHTSKFQI